MGWFSKKPSWEVMYAQRLYDAFAASDDLGEMTPQRLRIPLASYRRYADKALSQREIFCFVALMSAASPVQRPNLQLVMMAFSRLLEGKFRDRGISIDMDRFAEQSTQEVERMFANPFEWAQHWLSDFRDDPNDNHMVFLFADHCTRQFQAFKAGIENTYRA